jgi:hypothetical protein
MRAALLTVVCVKQYHAITFKVTHICDAYSLVIVVRKKYIKLLCVPQQQKHTAANVSTAVTVKVCVSWDDVLGNSRVFINASIAWC